jgi:hypothetical protein
MPSQPGTACSICLMGPTHRHTHLCQIVVAGCTVAPACCHLLVLCCFGCTGVCATCCVANSQVQAPWYVSDRINTRTSMHIYSTLFCCSDCAVAAAKYPDYCCTGFVQQVVESGYRRKVIQTDRTHQPGTLMSDSILVTYWATCFGHIQLLLLSAGCCVATACTGFVQHASQIQAAGVSDVNTRTTSIRALPCCAKLYRSKLVSCSCLQVNLATAGCGFVQHVQHAQLQAAHCMLDRSNIGIGTRDVLQACCALLQLLSCGSLPAVVFLLRRVCASCQVSARQVQPGLFDRLDTSQQILDVY